MRRALLFLFAACSSSSAPDAGGPEAGTDATIDASALDAADVGADVLDTQSTDFGDKAAWQTYGLGASGFRGGAYDGRYVYFAPYSTGEVARFDTQSAFSQASSWQKYDLKTIDSALGGFAGAVFDGTHVYLSPTDKVLTRFAVSGTFGSASSWETYALSAADASTQVYGAPALHGKSIYFVPCSGTAMRFDTTGGFTSQASYAQHFLSGVCEIVGAHDGKYLYFIPQRGPTPANQYPSGFVFRYDESKAFDDGTAYSNFDTQNTFDPAARQYGGAVFDGRYLYFIPKDGAGAVDSGAGALAVRYDTQATFGDVASWSKLDLSTVDAGAHGYVGGTFDGRYIYFAPQSTSIAMRYDTTLPFAAASSWHAFDLATIDAAARGYFGAVFDGKNVYFVPNATGKAARFHARTSAALPPMPSSFL